MIFSPFEWIIANVFLYLFQFAFIANNSFIKTFLPDRETKVAA